MQTNCWIETFVYFSFSRSQSWELEKNSEIHCVTKAPLLLLQSWVALSLKLRGSPYLIIQSGLVTNLTRWSLIDPNSKKETGCNNALEVHSLCFFTGLKILISSLKCSLPQFSAQVPWKLKTNRNSFCRNIRKRNVTPASHSCQNLSYMNCPLPQSIRRREFNVQFWPHLSSFAGND